MEQVATELTYRQQEEILQSKLHELVSTGWEVQSSTATSASVKLPKVQQSIVANLLLTIFTAGLWLFVWMLAWLANPRPYDVHAQVSVDSAGVVKTSKMGILKAKVTEDRRWAVAAAFEAGEYESQYPAGTSPAHFTQPNNVSEEDGQRLTYIGFKRRLVLHEDRLIVWHGYFSPTVERELPLSDISKVCAEKPSTYNHMLVIYGPDGEEFVRGDKESPKAVRRAVEALA